MCIRDRFAFFIHANNRELLVISFGIQIQEPIHPFPVFFGDRCDTPHLPQPRLTFVFFSISRIVSRLIVPKPSFWPYFLGCPLRGFSSSALARPSFKNRFLVRQIVVRSTSKKSSISISFLSLWSNKRILARSYSRWLLLPDFLKERK